MAGLTGIVVLASTNETAEKPPKRSSEKSGSDAKSRPADREDEDDEVPEDLIGRRGRDPDDGPTTKPMRKPAMARRQPGGLRSNSCMRSGSIPLAPTRQWASHVQGYVSRPLPTIVFSVMAR